MQLHGKSAIVTGGTGALGKVVVQQLFDAGANVAVPYRDESSLNMFPAEVRSTKGRFLAEKADLVVESEVKQLVTRVQTAFGTVDIVVNTAGGYSGGATIDEVSIDDWEKAMRQNLTTAFLMCKHTLAVMKKQGAGRIINIAAMPALAPAAKRGPYQVAKRGVITLTETIAAEVKGTAITANAIVPSIILTDSNKESMPDADFATWVTPDEIAQLIVFLAGSGGRSISGNSIKIYGGV
jgi:NAD(P)-dependent dehydrogenase (short-subunit alcohol dehydrogenase family)